MGDVEGGVDNGVVSLFGGLLLKRKQGRVQGEDTVSSNFRICLLRTEIDENIRFSGELGTSNYEKIITAAE